MGKGIRNREKTVTFDPINGLPKNSIYMKKIVIAIDGLSSCGKSTMAKALAQEIGYIYVDSGAMYRAVTLYALRNGLISETGVDREKLREAMPGIQIQFKLDAESGRPETYLNGERVETEIRTMEVSAWVSPISTLDFVRTGLVALQQQMGQNKGIVMDGRDIGTTVFPEAELKIFVTASAEVRAQRRYDELQAKGEHASFEEILKNVQERDEIDRTRSVSPLRQAADALLLDNTHLTKEEQRAWLLTQYQQTIQRLEATA